MSTTTTAGLDARDPRWEAAYEALAYTHEALLVARDEGLAPSLARVGDALRDFDAIDADGKRLRYGALRAAAHVQLADAALDRALGAFATDLLAHAGGDARAAAYTRFFPAPHDDVIDLGLDAEVPVVTLIVRALDQDEALPAALRAHREPLRAALQRGTAALVLRPDALAALGRHGARVEAWLEHAACTLRAVHRALRTFADERKLPPRWVQAFFRAGPLAP